MNIQQKLSDLLIRTKNINASNIRRIIDRKNLLTDLSQYPNKGVNFKAYKKHWPKGKYYKITSVTYQREVGQGEVFGVLYELGMNQSKYPEKIIDANKSNLWNHEPGDDNIEIENGMKFDQRYYDLFNKKNFPNKKKAWQLTIVYTILIKVVLFLFFFYFFSKFFSFYFQFFSSQKYLINQTNNHKPNHSINHNRQGSNHLLYIHYLFYQLQNELNDRNKKYKKNQKYLSQQTIPYYEVILEKYLPQSSML